MTQILLDGVVGIDTTHAAIRDQLSAAAGADIELLVSSPGGLVGEGLAIYNSLRNYPGQITAIITGYCMSIASYIVLAADRIEAEDNAVFMIHNTSGGVYGDHNEILQYGQMAKALSGIIAKAYAAHTHTPLKQITAWMDAETFFFGADIVSAGFAAALRQTDSATDATSATALARTALSACGRRLASDTTLIKTDLELAATYAAPRQPRAQATPTPAKKGAPAMTVEQLRADHSELVAAIEAEARHDMIAQADADQKTADLLALVKQIVPQASYDKLQQLLAAGVTAAQAAALGVGAAAEPAAANQQMLAAITAAAATPAAPGTPQPAAAPVLDTQAIYAARAQAMKTA